MLSGAVLAFSVAATCLLYQSFREISTKGMHFAGAGGPSQTSINDAAPDAQLAVLQQILAALNAQNGSTGVVDDKATGTG